MPEHVTKTANTSKFAAIAALLEDAHILAIQGQSTRLTQRQRQRLMKNLKRMLKRMESVCGKYP